MTRFLFRRIAYGIATALAATILVFGLSRMTGDPRNLYLTGYATQEQLDAWAKRLRLDRPLVVQYGIWLWGMLRGDFGTSLRSGGPASALIYERIGATFQLALASFVFAVMTGLPLGVLSAVKRGSIWDYVGRTFALFGMALPVFWTGILFILFFSVRLGWLPSGTKGGITSYILPSVTLGWHVSASILRLLRSAMLDVLDSEYIKFSRAKGIGESLIIWKHALRNAVIPPLTFSGILLAGFLGGTVVTETVFAWPGLGRLAVDAVMNNDFPLMTGTVTIVTTLYVVVTLAVDITYAYVDPRIRYV